jgi:hypothetical protein
MSMNTRLCDLDIGQVARRQTSNPGGEKIE